MNYIPNFSDSSMLIVCGSELALSVDTSLLFKLFLNPPKCVEVDVRESDSLLNGLKSSLFIKIELFPFSRFKMHHRMLSRCHALLFLFVLITTH